MDRRDNIALIYAKLSKDNQQYLFNMANMASIAEKAVINEKSKSGFQNETDNNEKKQLICE